MAGDAFDYVGDAVTTDRGNFACYTGHDTRQDVDNMVAVSGVVAASILMVVLVRRLSPLPALSKEQLAPAAAATLAVAVLIGFGSGVFSAERNSDIWFRTHASVVFSALGVVATAATLVYIVVEAVKRLAIVNGAGLNSGGQGADHRQD